MRLRSSFSHTVHPAGKIVALTENRPDRRVEGSRLAGLSHFRIVCYHSGHFYSKRVFFRKPDAEKHFECLAQPSLEIEVAQEQGKLTEICSFNKNALS